MESEPQEVKTLTRELAEKYFKARFSVDLAAFHYLEDEAAKIISKKENSCGLQLDGLCELSEKSAGFLARHVDSISLKGLPKISDSVAQILAKHKGPCLFLNGLTSLSESSAEALGKYRGQGLYLNGLANLSESSAEALGKFRNALSLQGLTEITENQAKSLAKKTSDLNLSGLKTISDEVAVALSKHKGGLLELNSLSKLSDKACENLVKHLGPLSFTGLAELSDAAFDMLKAFADSGTTLYLSSPYFQRFKDIKSGSSDSDDANKEPDESSRWQGPLSLSIGFKDGDYVNANLTKGIKDSEVLRGILRCKEILKKPKKGEGFVIGWSDLSDNSDGRLDQGDESSALMLFADIENFMNKWPSKKPVKRNKK